MMQYKKKNNKHNRKTFSMMRYRIIKGYAYDVTDDVMEGNITMMSYESGRAQNHKKHNIILSLELELLDREYKTHFSDFHIVKRVDVASVVEGVTSRLKFAKAVKLGGEWWKNIGAFLIAIMMFGAKGRNVRLRGVRGASTAFTNFSRLVTPSTTLATSTLFTIWKSEK